MRKQQILDELAQSRAQLFSSCQSVRRELDPRRQLGRLIRGRPLAWVGGATALGWILAGPKRKTRVVTKVVGESSGKPARKQKSREGMGLLAIVPALFRFAAPAIKPILTAYAGRRLAEIANRLPRE